MPGIVGGFSEDSSVLQSLRTAFDAAWPASYRYTQDRKGFLGFHSFAAISGFVRHASGAVIAIDGQRDAWRFARSVCNGSPHESIAQIARQIVEKHCCAVGAMAENGQQCLGLDPIGSFPLYFMRLKDGWIWSSRLSPMIRATGASLDDVAAVEFLRFGYTIGSRSLASDVDRLLPGQVHILTPGEDAPTVLETSKLWTGFAFEKRRSLGSVADEATDRMREVIAQLEVDGNSRVLLFSGGWDSRTLLGALQDRVEGSPIGLYTHGDLQSREAKLVRNLAERCQLPIHLESIQPAMLDLTSLKEGLSKVDSVVFPHWIHAGKLNREHGYKTAVAGVFGEVLGGHYGFSALLHGNAKARVVAYSLLRSSHSATHLNSDALSNLRSSLHVADINRAWYHAPEYWSTMSGIEAQINEDIDGDLDRLMQRGIESVEQLTEAYITEQRGARYINQQLLSCRSGLDVENPYATPAFLQWVSRIPFGYRIHNRLNRAMLRRFDRSLLRYPLAATLVPAGFPVVTQELSRALRKGWESYRWRRYMSTKGRMGAPRLGWSNLEYLRNSEVFASLIETLAGPWWNREGMLFWLDRLRHFKWQVPVKDVYEQLMKIVTVDLMFCAAKAPE